MSEEVAFPEVECVLAAVGAPKITVEYTSPLA